MNQVSGGYMFKDLLSPDIQPQQINCNIPEIVLSRDICEKLQSILEEEDKYAKVNPTTSLVKPDKNVVFFSNSWFYIAVLCKKFATSLYPYCTYFDTHIRNNKDVIECLLSPDKADISSKLSLSEQDSNRLLSFINGGEFRPGKNFINKEKSDKPNFRASKDVFGSCILKKIDVPDSSSSYLGKLVFYLVKHSEVYDQLEIEINEFLQDPKTQTLDSIVPPYEINKNPENKAICFNTNIKCKLPRNRIIFGAPGTGKSFLINNELTSLLDEFNVGDDNYERVTFHPDYSYANFVGTYKPVMVDYSIGQTLDEETKTNLEILKDPNKSAQEKYDFFYDNGQDIGLTRIPILIGITTDEPFHTKKSAGDDAANDNIVERNHGIALRKYVQLKGENSDVKSSEISYEYVPGPFMRMYVKALKSAQNVAKGTEPPRPFLLIIEEINRANVAAVFGDVFQLLDRKDNISEYPIQASEDIKKYLAKELGGKPEDYAKIKIPDNMFIWATMNSADQGVFPMDTAFKRRWDFTYLGIDDNDEELKGKFVSMIRNGEQKFVEWNSLRMAINEFLANEKINEDKQLGPYFIAKDVVVPATGNEIDKDKFNDVFKHKVLMYLFDDAAKQKRSKLFEGISAESSRYSKICKAFDEKGVDIFHSSIQKMVTTIGYLPGIKAPELTNGTEDWKDSDE